MHDGVTQMRASGAVALGAAVPVVAAIAQDEPSKDVDPRLFEDRIFDGVGAVAGAHHQPQALLGLRAGPPAVDLDAAVEVEARGAVGLPELHV